MNGAAKLPFRLDFDKYEDEYPATKNQNFFGFGRMTFTSNAKDESYMHQKLADEIFRERGAHVPRSQFVAVYVDRGCGAEY